ncbi:MAG: DUF3043 domain-containing protein [Frankiaceae bacterium]
MLRRRPDQPPTPTPAEQEPAGERPVKKGRPTPKRREAEARRRRPVGAAPADRATAREEARRRRIEVRTAMERGDESRMPTRDRGPARRFARDYVDSRRTIAEYFLPLGIILYVPLLFASAGVKSIASLALIALLLMLLAELGRLGAGLSRTLRDRFPDDERRGAVLYGLTRAAQTRRFRWPRPQVKVGQRPDARPIRK